jgi:predicted dehydrogenase
MRDVRWGIVGPGAIARGFAEAMSQTTGGSIVAVASRSLERANAFGDQFNVSRRYGDYGDLASDPDIDVVYIATPASRHEADTIAMLEAGKHVLCEKPFALNSVQAQRMVDVAAAAGSFLMEAMWSRFLPSYRKMMDLIDGGKIGEPNFVEANFGYRVPPTDIGNRHFDPHQGGGGLLDLGIYPVNLASMVLGVPERVSADGLIGPTGVDHTVAAVLGHPGGHLAVVQAAINVNMTCTARVAGTEGWIDLPAFMHCPHSFTVFNRETRNEVIDGSWEGNGMRFEIDEVHRCLAAGLVASPDIGWVESVSMMHTLDQIRAEIGLVFPAE